MVFTLLYQKLLSLSALKYDITLPLKQWWLERRLQELKTNYQGEIYIRVKNYVLVSLLNNNNHINLQCPRRNQSRGPKSPNDKLPSYLWITNNIWWVLTYIQSIKWWHIIYGHSAMGAFAIFKVPSLPFQNNDFFGTKCLSCVKRSI